MTREKGDLIIGKMFSKYGHKIGSCGCFPYDLVKETMEESKKEVIDNIPHSWLDSLFKDFLGKDKFTPKDIENMFVLLKKRLKQRHLSTSKRKQNEQR